MDNVQASLCDAELEPARGRGARKHVALASVEATPPGEFESRHDQVCPRLAQVVRRPCRLDGVHLRKPSRTGVNVAQARCHGNPPCGSHASQVSCWDRPNTITQWSSWGESSRPCQGRVRGRGAVGDRACAMLDGIRGVAKLAVMGKICPRRIASCLHGADFRVSQKFACAGQAADGSRMPVRTGAGGVGA